ncbi:Heme oxygenase (decyclizing) [Rhodopseudomonas palustris HaA2]|uniref:heme oxygenase (biliverdin-producing) n=1 Tax=Rhodopseudomonas palustris (strain HaA2) TaxID=316058 RepID=Q2ISY3_RHOP2|nr:biliverdin-producing heme oxygenase [Rhodopseudomonas palustris]ABD08677.1 Heme oxygenase (decyclizing) [Rhodopseudomonas palustris HaA2]
MVSVTAVSDEPSVVTALYLRTKALHLEAERTGIVADILRGAASRDGYVLLMRNLHPAYRELEDGIERHRNSPILAPLARWCLARTSAIAADLTALAGPNWAEQWPLLPEGEAYARTITLAAEGDGSRLIAHAYTRYLGDLNGGQIVRRLLEKSLGLGASELSHYDFSAIAEPATLKSDYRQALERAGAAAAASDAIVKEGAHAFECNIALSVAVQRRLADTLVPRPS